MKIIILAFALLLGGCRTLDSIRVDYTPEGTVKTIETRSNAPKVEITETGILVQAKERIEPSTSAGAKGVNYWHLGGVAMFLGALLAGIWGNFRVAILLAAGGGVMGTLGTLYSTTWFPVVGLLGLIGAGFLYWGYRVRGKQLMGDQ